MLEMFGDPTVRSIDSEIADLQRIIDADEGILQHETSQAKRGFLVSEIDNYKKKYRSCNEDGRDSSHLASQRQ